MRRSPPSEDVLPLDLHVLSLPLAFILSQDQTLRCKYKKFKISFAPDVSSQKSTKLVHLAFFCFIFCASKYQRTCVKKPAPLFTKKPMPVVYFIILFYWHSFILFLSSARTVSLFRGGKGKHFFLPAKSFLKKILFFFSRQKLNP